MNVSSIRVPNCISQFKTWPGGHRGRRLRSPKYIALWHMLVNAWQAGENALYAEAGIRFVDKQTCELEVNITWLHKHLSISRKTLNTWFEQYATNQLIRFENRYGGRGCGIRIQLLWIQQGQALAKRRETALAHQQEKRERKQQNLLTAKQRQTALKHPTGDVKHRACKDARLILTNALTHSKWRPLAIRACCAWIHHKQTTTEQITQVLQLLKTFKRLSVPRWVKTHSAVFRWIRGMIKNLLTHGKQWLKRFALKGELKTWPRIISALENAVDSNRPCPICQKIHSKRECVTGLSDRSGLSCLGWAREQLTLTREAWWHEHKEQRQPKAKRTPQEAWAQWQEEQARNRAFNEKRAEQTREKLRALRNS